MLGQSRIANTLNQLAHHVSLGALPVNDQTQMQIDEAYAFVLTFRAPSVRALGMKGWLSRATGVGPGPIWRCT